MCWRLLAIARDWTRGSLTFWRRVVVLNEDQKKFRSGNRQKRRDTEQALEIQGRNKLLIYHLMLQQLIIRVCERQREKNPQRRMKEDSKVVLIFAFQSHGTLRSGEMLRILSQEKHMYMHTKCCATFLELQASLEPVFLGKFLLLTVPTHLTKIWGRGFVSILLIWLMVPSPGITWTEEKKQGLKGMAWKDSLWIILNLTTHIQQKVD
ncbi:uncharacterized protein LOC129144958 isoform X1 [Talpa occidentalis]|uniref:uncharacterized protein LOC129144958 isoform X1 n=1 Tax=Talpa occidentalis TaxID=50954 RepID=UPI0023F7FFD2|nr:uncharacterized protein LOC129144958 isoform X1 [Talpa occidentalis]